MNVDGNRFRRARFSRFLDLADRAAVRGRATRILDIGGTRNYWEALRPHWEGRDFDITIVNLSGDEGEDGRYHLRRGDGCAMTGHKDNSFDLVHSNSVIEHVGRWPQMKAMAREVRRLAPHYYVQTPNLWFALEPHYRSLFFAWLPDATRAAKLTRRRHGFRGSFADYGAAMADVHSVNLLDARGMRALFPDGQLIRERVLGFTKSLVMVR